MCAAVAHEAAHRGGAHRADAASSCDSSSSCGPSAACVRAARSKGKLRRRGERPGGREGLPAHGKRQLRKETEVQKGEKEAERGGDQRVRAGSGLASEKLAGITD